MAPPLTAPAQQPDAAEAPGPAPAVWRAAMGAFPTGVTVATSWLGSEPMGSTINAFCSVSLNPPLLLICLDKLNPLFGPVQESGVFGVNILGCEDGERLARHFAVGPEIGRFAALPYRIAAAGAPQLEAAPVFIDCALEAIHDAGDHVVVIGRGVRVEHGPAAPPLLYHRGTFPKLPSEP